MWQAPRQQHYRDACQISERYDKMAAISQTTFSGVFSWKKSRVLIRVLLKFVQKGLIENKSILVQVMTWPPKGDKPLPESMIPSSLAHICGTMGNELKDTISWLRDFTRSCGKTSVRSVNRGPRRKIILCWTHKVHDDVIKWKHFPRYWPFVRGIHRSPVNSPHKGQWRGALMFPVICTWINGWINNREAGDLRRHPAHYDVMVM